MYIYSIIEDIIESNVIIEKTDSYFQMRLSERKRKFIPFSIYIFFFFHTRINFSTAFSHASYTTL